MKKLLLVFLMALSAGVFAQDADLQKYLDKNAVPVVDGKVVFSDKVDILDGYTAEQVGDIATKWLDGMLKKNDPQRNRIVLNKDNKITALGYIEVVFTNNAISFDRAFMHCAILVDYSAKECSVSIERIKYDYTDGGKKSVFLAEDYITYENAVNKKGTKLMLITGKFRKGTIDKTDEIFDSFKDAFKYYTKQGLAEVAKNAPHLMLAQPVQAAQPVQPAQQAAQSKAEEPAAAAPAEKHSVVSAAQSAEKSAASLAGYRQVSPENIPGNFIKMVSNDWMLITAGGKEKFNMMTASWGGIGVLYNKPVAICFINPARYTYQVIENSDTYTLTFYTEAYRDALKYCGSKSGRDEDKVKGSGLTPVETANGAMAFGEAWMIIECKKLVSQSISLDAINNKEEQSKRASQPMHKMYIGEILNVWVK